MKFTFKRKSSKAKSVLSASKSVSVGETMIYGSGKVEDTEYHQIPFLSAHVIKDLANRNLSDYYLWRKYVKRDLPKVDSDKFIVGRAFHTAVLEPKLYNKIYVVMPKMDKRTKAGKEAYETFMLEHGHKQVITEQQDEMVKSMAAAVKKNQYARHMLAGTHAEVTGITKLDNDVMLKGRIDAISYEYKYGVDVKSCEDISPAGFAKAAANYRYDIQEYVYKKLFGLDDFVFICCSKSEPYETAIYQLNDEFSEKAAEDYELAIKRWIEINDKSKEATTFGNVPMVTLAPPAFYKYM